MRSIVSARHLGHVFQEWAAQLAAAPDAAPCDGPGTKVACLLASAVASRQLQFASAGAIVSRGNCRAAQALARGGAARVSVRSVRPNRIPILV